jgi:hypothetical protein
MSGGCPRWRILIDLGIRENLQTELETDFTNNLGAGALGFITKRAGGGIVPRNNELMETGCFKSSCRFSITHPYV